MAARPHNQGQTTAASASSSSAMTQALPSPGVAQPQSPTGSVSPVSPASRTMSTRQDRRNSDEWDASKVPPSRFQKRKGSIYAVPSSRDGHVDSNYAAKFHQKHAEMGYGKEVTRR